MSRIFYKILKGARGGDLPALDQRSGGAGIGREDFVALFGSQVGIISEIGDFLVRIDFAIAFDEAWSARAGLKEKKKKDGSERKKSRNWMAEFYFRVPALS